MFGKRFIRLSVKTVQNFQRISLKKLYAEFLCVNILAMFNVITRFCIDEKRTWVGLLDWTYCECHRESQRQSCAPVAAGSVSHQMS